MNAKKYLTGWLVAKHRRQVQAITEGGGSIKGLDDMAL